MIKVIDDWYIEIESNPTNYTLRRGSGRKDKKGRCRDKVYGYYGSLGNALKALRKEIATDELSQGFRTLSEAVRTIKEVDARFEKIISAIDV